MTDDSPSWDDLLDSPPAQVSGGTVSAMNDDGPVSRVVASAIKENVPVWQKQGVDPDEIDRRLANIANSAQKNAGFNPDNLDAKPPKWDELKEAQPPKWDELSDVPPAQKQFLNVQAGSSTAQPTMLSSLATALRDAPISGRGMQVSQGDQNQPTKDQQYAAAGDRDAAEVDAQRQAQGTDYNPNQYTNYNSTTPVYNSPSAELAQPDQFAAPGGVQSPLDYFQNIAEASRAGMGKQLSGALQAGGEYLQSLSHNITAPIHALTDADVQTGLDTLGKNIADAGVRATDKYTAEDYLAHGHLLQNEPEPMGKVLESVQEAVINAPELGAAIAAPEAAPAIFGIGAAAQKYGEARQEGEAPETAATAAGLEGIASALTAQLSVGRALSPELKSAVERIAESSGTFSAANVLQEANNIATEQNVEGKQVSPEEVQQRLMRAGVSGLGPGALLGGFGAIKLHETDAEKVNRLREEFEAANQGKETPATDAAQPDTAQPMSPEDVVAAAKERMESLDPKSDEHQWLAANINNPRAIAADYGLKMTEAATPPKALPAPPTFIADAQGNIVPHIPDGNLYSRTAAPGEGLTQEQALDALNEHFSKIGAGKLQRAGVQLLSREQIEPFTQDLTPEQRAGVKGFTTPDGRVFVVHDAHDSGDGLAKTVVHEVTHANLEKILTPTQLTSFASAIDRYAKNNPDSDTAKAHAAIPSDTPAEQMPQEKIAYALEHAQNDKPTTRVLDALKLGLNRLGVPLDWLNGHEAALREIGAANLRDYVDYGNSNHYQFGAPHYSRDDTSGIEVNENPTPEDHAEVARMFAAQKSRFDENEAQQAQAEPQDAFVRRIWKTLAQKEDIFQNPRVDENDVNAAMEKAGVGAVRRGIQNESDENGNYKSHYFTTDKGSPFTVKEYPKSLQVNVSDLKPGESGNAIYNAVSGLAKRTGKSFEGDTQGMSDTAVLRRTDNMMSAMLKYGHDVVAPHERQRIPGGDVAWAAPLKWQTGKDDANLSSVIHTQAENVARLLPEIKDWKYNFSTDRFEKSDGSPVTQDDFNGMSELAGERFKPRDRQHRLQQAEKLGAANSVDGGAAASAEGEAPKLATPTPYGRTSIARAALTRSLESATGEEARRAALAWSRLQLPEHLEKTLYSRTDEAPKGASLLAGRFHYAATAVARNTTGAPVAAPRVAPPHGFAFSPQAVKAALPAVNEKQLGRRIDRAAWAQMDRAVGTADRAMEAARAHFDAMLRKTDDPRAIYDGVIAYQQGRVIQDPVVRDIMNTIGHMFVDQAQRITAYGADKLSLVNNYFPQFWKDPVQAERLYTGMAAKRPLSGNKSFTKERVFADIEEGLNAGFEPAFKNPMDGVMQRYANGERYISALRIQDELHKAGLITPYAGGRIPAGRAIVNDPLFRNVLVPEPIAKDLNNYLAPGLNQFKAWRGFRFLQNTLLSSNLGFSAFHAGFTTMDSAVTHLALAGSRLAMGDLTGGIGQILQIPLTPLRTLGSLASGLSFGRHRMPALTEGAKFMRAFYGEGPMKDQHTAALLEALTEGGARGNMHPTDTNSEFDKAWRASRMLSMSHFTGDTLTDKLTTPFRVFSAAAEASTRLIGQHLVPAQKMFARVEMMKYELDRIAKMYPTMGQMGDYAGIINKMNPDALRKVAYDVTQQVDDRLGQVAYDNLFWNKMLKEGAQAAIQSVGWNFGTLNVIWKGHADMARLFKPEVLDMPLDKAGAILGAGTSGTQGSKAFRSVTGRMAYMMALYTMVGGINGITQYLLTGQGPQETKDWFYPKTGRANPDGTAERIALPSYLKDEYSLMNRPWDTFIHKLHPIFGAAAELSENKDYFGNQIYNEDDPRTARAEQIGKYLANRILPYAVQNQRQIAKSGGGVGQRSLPFVGVVPAPASVTRTPFEQYVTDRYWAHNQDEKTPEQAENSKNFSDAVKAIKSGQTPDLNGLSQSAREKVYKYAKFGDPYEYRFTKLFPSFTNPKADPMNMLVAYEKATPAEREKYGLRSKILSLTGNGDADDKWGKALDNVGDDYTRNLMKERLNNIINEH